MRKKDRKKSFFKFLPHECQAAEEYLEEMAEKGWLLVYVEPLYMGFKKIEPKRIKYSVDVLHKISELDPIDTDTALEYREYCQAAGWNYIGQRGKIQIFYTEDYENTISIHTDPKEKFKSIVKASISNIIGQLVLILLFAANIYLQVFTGNVEYTFSNNIGLLALLSLGSIIILNSIELLAFFYWFIKGCISLKQNKNLSYNKFAHIKLKYMFRYVYALVLLFMVLGLVLFNDKVNSGFYLWTLGMFLIFIIGALATRAFINKKSCSRFTNAGIITLNVIISVVLLSTIIMTIAIYSVTDNKYEKRSIEKAQLAFRDFGYSLYDEKPYIRFTESILASSETCYLSDNGVNLDYTIFTSQSSWIVKFYGNRIIHRFDKYDGNFTIIDWKPSKDIEVCSNEGRKHYIIVAKNKVVDIRNDFKDINEEEFLNTVYNELFVD